MKEEQYSGLIQPGETCKFSDECYFKEMACNGEGCPVSDGMTVKHTFSCGAYRLFKLTERIW